MTTQSPCLFQSLIAQAHRKYKNREYESASETYVYALDQLKNMEQMLVDKYYRSLTSLYGLVQSHLSNYTKSFEAYDQVLELDPLNVGTILRRALLFMKIGQYQKSWKDLQKAMVLEPQNHRIEFYIEQLNEKMAELREGDKRKYLIKQEIAEVIKFPEIEQDMLLNFSGLKNIDKQSVCSSKISKVVSILKEPTATIEVEREFDMNFLLAALVKQVVLTREQIMEIEKQHQFELEPNRLNEQISNQMASLSDVKVLYDSQNPVTQSILKSILGFGLEEMTSISRHQSNISNTSEGQSFRRMSALQIKNIDGKIVRSSDVADCGDSDEEKSSSDINFGRISDIEELGKKQAPIYKNHALKRKSSLRKGASITTRPKQKSMFERGNIDLFSVNIDGPVIRHESTKQLFQTHHETQQQGKESDCQRVSISDRTEDIEQSIQVRKQSHHVTIDEESILPGLGIGATGLQRKESILKKSKRKYQEPQETQN